MVPLSRNSCNLSGNRYRRAFIVEMLGRFGLRPLGFVV